MTPRPVLGVVARPGETRALRPLARALSHHVEVRAAGRCSPEAVLATSGEALATWPGPGITVVWDASHQVLDTGDGSPLPCPAHARDLAGLVAHGPLVRARWRARLGRPEPWVVDAAALPVGERLEALRVATAAAVADPDDLVVALALGCPAATPAEVAESVGVGPEQVVLAPVQDLLASAEDLAADPVRAAALARRGRDHAEAHLDLDRVVRALLDRLRLGRAEDAPTASPPLAAEPGDLLALVERHLDALGTPAVSRIRTRATHALALSGAGTPPARPDPALEPA